MAANQEGGKGENLARGLQPRGRVCGPREYLAAGLPRLVAKLVKDRLGVIFNTKVILLLVLFISICVYISVLLFMAPTAIRKIERKMS